MRALLAVTLFAVFSGCTFGVKTCTVSAECNAGGQCVQGVCTIPIPVATADAGGEIETPDAGDDDAGMTGGGAGGGTGGGEADGGAGGGAGGGGGGAFDAGPLVGVVFLTPPRVARAGECSEVIQVGVFEDAGVEPLSVAFANEDTTFFSDSICTSAATDFVIPASGVVSLYFMSPVIGSVLVNVSHDLTEGVTQVQRVIGGRPGRLSFGAPTSVAAGACSSPVLLQVKDDFGNMASLNAPLVVALSSNSTTTQFFSESDATCQSPLMPAVVSLQAGASQSAFRFRDSVPGLPVFGADAPDAGSEGPLVEPASQEQEVF